MSLSFFSDKNEKGEKREKTGECRCGMDHMSLARGKREREREKDEAAFPNCLHIHNLVSHKCTLLIRRGEGVREGERECLA